MRICYINPTNNIRRPIAELSRILADQGHSITLIYPNNPKCKTSDFHFIQLLDHPNIKVVPIESYYYARLRYSFPKIIDLIKKSKQILKDSDIIHIWEYYYPISVIPIFLSIFTKDRKKIILTSDGFVGYSYKPSQPSWLVPGFKLYTNIIARFIFKLVPRITTYGNAMIPFAKEAHVPIAKLKILPTGIHIAKFQSALDLNPIRTEFNLKNSFVILFVGMLTERKNIDIVVRVSIKLLEAGFIIKTVIVGDGPLEKEFKSMVPLKFQNDIIFAGGRKDIPAFYQAANVLLLPSMGEGLPGVVMESMASGLPTIATNEGCTPDLIISGKTGLLANPYDEVGFYNQIVRIMDKTLHKDISTNGLIRIKQFSWDIISQKYLEYYKQP